MTILYLLNRRHSLAEVQPLLAADDQVLLCGDAVLDALGASSPLLALDEDVQARNLQLSDAVALLGYEEFVELCTQHARVVAW